MVGKGVLLECLDSPIIDAITVINRRSLDIKHPKLEELIVEDFKQSNALQLNGFDACYFCMGVSALGLNEAQYKAITYDLTLNFAQHLVKTNAQCIFCYVSGQGTNINSSTMWARVKGQTEEDLKSVGFIKVYLFRPGFIQPLRGIKSRTSWYNAIYLILNPFSKILKASFKNSITDTTSLGQAMINILTTDWPKQVLDNQEINKLAEYHPA